MSRIVGKTEQGQDIRAYDIPEMDVITKGQGVSDFEILMVASTEIVDRDQEALAIDGWKLNNFKRNPAILMAHNGFGPTVARGKDVNIREGKLRVRIEFPPEGTYELSDILRRLYKADFMRAGSIGFLPINWEYGDGKSTQYWRKFTEQEMLEFSLCAVGANPDALMEGKTGLREATKAGVIKQAEMDILRKTIFEALDLELKEGIKIFVPKSVDPEETETPKEDGDPNEQQQDAPPVSEQSNPDEPGDQKPEDQAAGDPGDPQEGEEAPGGDETETQKRYRAHLKKELLSLLKTDEGIDLIKSALEFIEARKHYSQILLGDKDRESESSPKESDQLKSAITSGIAEGLRDS